MLVIPKDLRAEKAALKETLAELNVIPDIDVSSMCEIQILQLFLNVFLGEIDSTINS